MNKSIHQRLNAQVIAAAAAVALAVPSASLARTVSVAAIKDGLATAAFGDADGKAYTLAWGYGDADGGAATNGWAHFETLGEVANGDTSRSVALPAGWGDTATHLRFFLLEPELPAAATRVQYIQSAGAQWIDSGVNGETGLKFRADLEWDASHDGKADWVLVGARNGIANSDYTRIVPVYIEKAVCFGYGRFVRTTTRTDLGVRHEIVTDFTDGSAVSISRAGTPITGYESGYYPSTGTVDAGRNLYIFAANWGGSANLFAKAKLYGLEIQRKNATTGALEPVRNFVPCTTNGVACLYDTVGRRYYGNSGTGSFSAGATLATPIVVAAISATASAADYGEPDEYLDYVEGTGTQYVDSGVNLCSNDTVVAEYEIPAALTKTVDLFGVHRHGLTARYVFSYDSNSGSSTIVFHRANASQGATETKTSVTVTPGARQTVTMKIGPGTSSIVAASGESLYSGTLTARTVQQDATGSLAIFGCNSSQYGFMALCSARLYSLRIYDENGSLAHNFLPCKKFDAAGLYDKATGRILFATGDEDLVAGPVLPRPAELVEWVQSDGSSGDRHLYIDTGVVAKNDMTMAAEMEWVEKPSAQSTFCGASNNVSFLTLYTSAGTHQCGYSTSSQYQIGGGGNAATAGVRFRILSALVRSAQSLEVWALNGASAGYYGQRTNTSKEWVNLKIPLYIFARNDAGTPAQFAAARLYSLVLTNELGVLRDFVPCVADNGKAGLYDTVSERIFFPQAAKSGATSNDFDPATEIGAVTNVLAAAAAPSARLSYVESDGTSDFVDLGIIGKDGIKMVAEISWTVMPDDDVLCGARTGNNRFMLYNSYNNLHSYCYANGAPTIGAAGAPVVGDRYRVTTILEAGSQSCSVQKFANGAWSAANIRDDVNATGPIDTGLPLYLFARNMDGIADCFAAARVYSLKLWQKNGNGDYELVRDLVPAKGPEGGAALWDRVTNRYFRPASGRYGLTAGVESPWIAGFMMRFR